MQNALALRSNVVTVLDSLNILSLQLSPKYTRYHYDTKR